MSKGQIVITGGAGFIGSHLADELPHHGYSVRVLDVLLPQVHGVTRHTSTRRSNSWVLKTIGLFIF